MRLFRVGGYNGPVTIYTEHGEEIAHAGCRSSADQDYDGSPSQWSGELRHIAPHGSIEAGVYRLQFPDGERGDVRVRPLAADRLFAYFQGVGSHPLHHN
jgi:hypothetical protein